MISILKYDNEGKYHAEGEPAVVLADGSSLWYKHGKLHREDGPAMIDSSSNDEYYYLNGIKIENGETL